MYQFRVSIPIYDFRCTIIIDDNIEKVIDRYLKKFKIAKNSESDEYDGFAISTPLKKYYIFYSVHSLTPNTIVHEISHIVDYIIEDRDIEHFGESRAYLTGYITGKVFDFVLKNKLLISKDVHYIQKNLTNAPMAERSKAGDCKSS